MKLTFAKLYSAFIVLPMGIYIAYRAGVIIWPVDHLVAVGSVAGVIGMTFEAFIHPWSNRRSALSEAEEGR